jgi:hypothetical protein
MLKASFPIACVDLFVVQKLTSKKYLEIKNIYILIYSRWLSASPQTGTLGNHSCTSIHISRIPTYCVSVYSVALDSLQASSISNMSDMADSLTDELEMDIMRVSLLRGGGRGRGWRVGGGVGLVRVR